MSHTNIDLNRTMWRHRAVWYVGSDVLSLSTEPSPPDVSGMFRDASSNCTSIAGVTTLVRTVLTTSASAVCLQAAAHIKKRTEGSLLLPDFLHTFMVVTKKRVE